MKSAVDILHHLAAVLQGWTTESANSKTAESQMHKVVPKGWPADRWVPVCDSCVQGKHLSYGSSHLPSGETDDPSRWGCKNLGHIEGKRLQCACSPGFPELMESLKSKKASEKTDVLYIVHPETILEQQPHVKHVKPFIDKLSQRINSFSGPVIVSRVDWTTAKKEYDKGRPELLQGHDYVEKFLDSLGSRATIVTEERGNPDPIGKKSGKVIDDLFLEGKLGMIILGGCFKGKDYPMCIEGTRKTLIREYGEGHVKVDDSISMTAGPIDTKTLKTADYPDHPDQIVISKGELWGGSHEISEVDVWNYYTGAKSKMLEELRGRNLFIAVKPEGVLRKGQKPIYIRHPYDKKTEYIRISGEKDFETYHSGRTVEFHVTMPQMAPYYVIDFDAGDEPFSQTKKITADIADKLGKLPEVKSVEIRYTGKRGFHVLGWLRKAKDVNDARNFLKDWLKKNFGERDDVTIAESPSGKKGALGLSPMKVNGGQVAKWSLRVTGLCCVEVPRASLMSFEKESASLEKTFKKATGRSFAFGQEKAEKKAAINKVIDSFLHRESMPCVGHADLFLEALSKTNVKRVLDDLENGRDIYLPQYKDRPARMLNRRDLDVDDLKILHTYPWARTHNPNPPLKYENGHYVENPEFVTKIAGYDRGQLQAGYKGKFVIQQHEADKAGLHWDLRLEFPVTSLAKALGHYGTKRTEETPEPSDEFPDKPGTVYRSFAVRKHRFPTADIKVFVVETENHPIAYGKFEGTIPEGEYGAGSVKVWDHGNYEMVDVEGDSKYVLEFYGRKLTGQYALVKYQKGFLWVKVKGKTASAIDYPQATLSPQVWDLNGEPPKLLGSVRSKIISGLVRAFEAAGMSKPLSWITSLTISGSSAGYNYQMKSDLDIDICYDQNIFKSINSSFAKLSDDVLLKTLSRVVEELGDKPETSLEYSYLVLAEGDAPSGDGLYDVLADQWVKIPERIPMNFDPDKAFVLQKQKAFTVIAHVDFLIRNIVAAAKDLELVEQRHQEAKRVILMVRLRKMCLDIDGLHEFIWDLQTDSKDPQLPHSYPAFDFSANWDERMIIFKYIVRYGYQTPIHLLYARLKGSPVFDVIDRFIPD